MTEVKVWIRTLPLWVPWWTVGRLRWPRRGYASSLGVHLGRIAVVVTIAR